MPTTRRSVDHADAPPLSAATKARLDAMTSAEIERGAVEDAGNPPMTAEELERAVFARTVRQTRKITGLNQAAFAGRYHIGLGRLRDWEQGRVRPDSVALAYLKLIRGAPDTVAATIDDAKIGSAGAATRAG